MTKITKKSTVLKDKNSENQPLINESIPFSRVLLIDGEEKKTINKQEALDQARKNGLDLLCVSPSANPPVCKLVDYQKCLFELSKKKKKNKENTFKEIRISFKIEENDLNVKLGKVHKWLEESSMVKINLVMVGKEKTHQELARQKCHNIVEKLQTYSSKIELKDNIRPHFGSLYFFVYKKKQ